MKNLIKNLQDLSLTCNVIGIKQSFEDEGVSTEDVILARRITDKCNLQSFVKIGGCEAKSDLNKCIKIGIDNIIAPMVESEFSLSKFINITNSHSDSINRYILVETKTAYQNIDELLNLAKNNLDGIIVGRSDFSKSYNLNKSECDNEFIFEKVEDIFIKCKKENLQTTLGGNISTKSIKFIKEMYLNSLLDKIETRNIVVKLNDSNVSNLEHTIQSILKFEIEWTQFKRNNLSSSLEDLDDRIRILNNR
jgi:hypothetical protein